MKYTVPILILATVASITALIIGGAHLEVRMPGGLPVGNLMAACTLVAPAGAAIRLSPAKALVRYFSIVSFVAACVWLPVSIALAGNLMLNFDGDRGEVWSKLTVLTAVAVCGSLAWAGIHQLVIRLKAGRMNT